MEQKYEFEKIKTDTHMRTEYGRGSPGFGIELGKKVKLPNLGRIILNTSRQELDENGKNCISLEKEKQNPRNRERKLPRFTSQDLVKRAEEEKTEILPKINNKMIKQTSMKRLQRINSEQSMINQNFQTIGTYRVGGVIGKGFYASVRLVKSWNGGSFAMKIYDKTKINDSAQMSNIRNQIQVMEQIDHPNLIKYVETFHLPDSINIVMELVENNSLLDYLRVQKNKKVSEDNGKVIMKDILKAVSYLHSKNIVHRDLKFENILISKDMRIKIIDFGFSINDNQIHYDFCGTPHYISPEIISKGGYTGQPADIWALGVIMYKLLTGCFPFKGLNDKILYRKICRGEYSDMPELSFESSSMIGKMFAMDPSERPSAAELLKHEWFFRRKRLHTTIQE